MELEPISVSKNFKMNRIYCSLPSIARVGATVLILGESGVGKEVLARKIHSLGPRRDNEFVAFNCAAVPEGLLESEMFGFKKGAFTGATSDSQGLIESAHGGTLFLDEIGDMPMSVQVKLLRVLQQKSFRALGETCERKSNFRLISATHRDLRELILNGKFREDLFYRINVVPIRLPPLRERMEDFADLLSHFIETTSKKYRCRPFELSDAALAKLISYPWPGNIRELENVVERLVLTSVKGSCIDIADLECVDVCSTYDTSRLGFAASLGDEFRTVDEIVNEYIKFVLERVHHQKAAAKILGLSRRTIYRRMRPN